MPRGLPGIVKNLLEKARGSALQAVAAYNNPLASFRSGTFIVLMMIAWTSLFLAIFHRQKVKPYYRKKKKESNQETRFFQRVDGEPRAWELTECIRQYWGESDNAVAQNIRFFIGLRNKIEHREMPQLDIEIFGESQALLFNFEDLLEKEFGSKYAINESLAISLQFSRLRDTKQQQAVRQLTKPLAGNVKDYIEKFRSALTDDILGDMAYSYKVFLLPMVGSHRSKEALAVEFVHYDPDDPEQMEMYEKVAAFVKEKHVPVVHPGKFKPSGVVDRVAPALSPKKFNVTTHTCCWRYYKVRPPSRSKKPAKCDTKYCQYDEVHKDYVYTKEWVEFLIKELSDDTKYDQVAGKRTKIMALASD